MGMMEDFKTGKIAVYAKKPEESKRFLKACEKAGLRWLESGAATKPRFDGDVEFAYKYGGFSSLSFASHTAEAPTKGWHSRHAHDGKPYKPVTVAEFFVSPKLSEQLIIYRNADSITAIHKIGGKEAGRASVTRYYKDADDFLTGAMAAVAKLREGAKPYEYKVGDKVRVCASCMLKMARMAGHASFPPRREFTGRIKTLNASWCGVPAIGVYQDETNTGWRTVLPEDILGLAE